MLGRGLQFSLTKYVAAAVLGMAILAVSVIAGVDVAVERAVSADAQLRAEDWAKYFIKALPNLDGLFAAGKLDDAQARVVSTAAKVGNVFRFKLYDQTGKTVIQSDSQNFGKDEDDDHVDDEVFDVVRDKKAVVSLNDGTKERDMPALYAEAYVPVVSAGGNLLAVVETYVDETKTAQFFKTSFDLLAIGLGAGIALAFGIPTLAFLFRTKQAREVGHRAEFLASHDAMTSLLNRATFADRLAKDIATLAPGERLGVAYFDVDDFKTINDSFGHEAGDVFLKHVARSISAGCSDADFVARAGGDEFIVALHRASDTELVATVEAMMEVVRGPVDTQGGRLAGRLSGGIYVVESSDEHVEDGLNHADTALYQAKIDGKNSLRLFSTEIDGRMRARRELEHRLHEALALGLFELNYQPLLDARTKTCAGFEALLRMRDSAGVPIPPMTFIPVAEQLGLIDKIGKWALEEATRTAALWPAPMFVSVNLSVRQFVGGDLVANVERALADSGLAPNRLELEVTESLLMENTESVARQLQTLRKMGVSIAMDDFGTGYSSLGYLWQFGFDKLKIDRSFILALDQDEKKAREVLDTIVMLAHKLEMKVTAEGIETEQQAAILNGLACDQFQGFLYGKPMPATDIAGILLRQVVPLTGNVPPDSAISA